MNTADTAQRVLDAVGGEGNVDNLTHCVTRLRFTLKSKEGVDAEKVKAIPGVLGAVDQGGQFQVIIGPEVVSVYNELTRLADLKGGGATSADTDVPDSMNAPETEKKGVVNVVLDTIAGIFSPIMPVIAGAGMIKALLSILVLFDAIDKSGQLYYFLSFIADAGYYFLPVYLAASAAKKFHCNMFMAMMLGGMLLHPNFSALGSSGDVVDVAGFPVRIVTYASSVIPVLMIVFVYSYIERFFEKHVPSVIKFIAKPLLSLLVMAPISFCVLGPIGGIIGDGLVSALLAIQEVAPWVMPTVIGAFMPLLVMTGMHYSLLPAYVNSLSALGYETVIGPGNLPSNIAQGAAALCVALKTKNEEFRQLAVSSGITALLGITEPALFGVNLRLKRPLVAMAIGGGMGGLFAGIMGVQRFGGGGAGLAAIGLYVGDNPMNVVYALISAAIAFVVTFVAMWIIGFEDVPVDAEIDDPVSA